MVRISSVDIPSEKRIEIALTYMYGIGRALSNVVLKEAKIDPNLRAKNLTEEQVLRIKDIIEKKFPVEGELRRIEATNIKRLKEIGSYMGLRHIKGLPVYGQRTKTNARTKKGRRSAIGGIRKV